jgi:leucyl-tRNA synthetase
MRALHAMGLVPVAEPFTRFRAHGMIIMDGAKMSKSRGNVLNPDEYIDKFGADTVRLFMMYLGPYTLGGDFRDKGIAGMTRFINRSWRATQLATADAPNDDVKERRRHRLIKQVEDDIAELRYNTAIAHLMEFARDLDHESQAGAGRRVDAETLLKLLAPFAPFVTEELWNRLGHESSVHDRGTWPAYDAELAAPQRATIAITVNGKRRAELEVDAGTPEAVLSEQALAHPRVVELLGGRAPRAVIAVVDRIVNIVTA